ncbi:hypothetical protein AAUPMC_16605, partial [Pasteurella multocida subsp. multocida str. Anand1_cattle]
ARRIEKQGINCNVTLFITLKAARAVPCAEAGVT